VLRKDPRLASPNDLKTVISRFCARSSNFTEFCGDIARLLKRHFHNPQPKVRAQTRWQKFPHQTQRGKMAASLDSQTENSLHVGVGASRAGPKPLKLAAVRNWVM
jgi:hypothetical protein